MLGGCFIDLVANEQVGQHLEVKILLGFAWLVMLDDSNHFDLRLLLSGLYRQSSQRCR